MMNWKKRIARIVVLALAAPLFSYAPQGLAIDTAYASGTKITLTTAMVTNETGYGDATMLVDEQSTAGDPRYGTGGSPATYWDPGFQSGHTPAYAYIDLGQMYDIDAVYLRDHTNYGYFDIYSGSPGSWTQLAQVYTNTYQQWLAETVSVQTRYIRVQKETNTANVSEIVLYGTPVSAGDTSAPAAVDDLAAGSSTNHSLQLSWTAPGDDGSTGTAASYDIRYSTSVIDDTNWAAATEASGEPAPAAAGTPQSMTIDGLAAATTYYFAMKTKDEADNESPLSAGTVSGATSAAVSAKLAITPTMVVNEINHEDAGAMFDEQTAAADPRSAAGGTVTTSWYLYGNVYSGHSPESWWLPASAYVDLGRRYHITDIYYYNGNGSTTDALKVSTGSPFDWDIAFMDDLTGSGWEGQSINADTRYIRYTLASASAKVHEMVVYGYPIEDYPDETPVLTPHSKPLWDDYMGINALYDDINDPGDSIEVAKVVREYHNWDVTGGSAAYPNNENLFNPIATGFDYDNFFTSLYNNGTTVNLAFNHKKSASWVTNDYNDPRIVLAGLDSTLPSGYAAHADYLYQQAARYGSTAVADANLKVVSGQTRSTGLGVLEYIEAFNEPNWYNSPSRLDYLSAYEYAAMLSADYDGHEGTMGTTVGVKNADPNMKLAAGGLIGFDLDYLKLAVEWAKHNRTDGEFPADVLNFHTYCDNSSHTEAVSPEQCQLEDKTKAMVDYRDAYMPGKEVWVSEFGYDTDPASPIAPPTIGAKDEEEVSADWLVRSYLAMSSAGIDRAMMYMLRDAIGAASVRFNTSGLVTQKGYWDKKPGWYFVSTLGKTLNGTRFLDKQSSGNANVTIYKYHDATGDGGVYVLWCPTSNGTTVNNYALSLSGAPSSATQISLVDGDDDGVASGLTIGSGTVTVNVSETPVFIRVDDM